LTVSVRILVGASLVWAVAALTVQVVLARGSGRRDFSRRAGSPLRGLLYSFTGAMLPWHKETIRGHPMQFAAGLLMHAGVILCLLSAVLLAASPELGQRVWSELRLPLLLPLVASVYLLARRVWSPTLRTLSVPDDYLAVLVTTGLLTLGAVGSAFAAGQTVFLIYCSLLLVYLPLGKLRHAVFFFIARGDLGRRLGYRGVYPPVAKD